MSEFGWPDVVLMSTTRVLPERHGFTVKDHFDSKYGLYDCGEKLTAKRLPRGFAFL
jgi:hypothetical protein